MPKQRIEFTRTQSVTVEFDYPVDPVTVANAEHWANHSAGGVSPLGQSLPANGQISASTSDWKARKSEPGFCKCEETLPVRVAAAKGKKNPTRKAK